MENKKIERFNDLGVRQEIIHGLNAQGIVSPTEIQIEIIKPFIEKKDIIAQSETGSGKTLAYLIPLFMMIDTSMRKTQAIILTPTHELAAQVYKQAELLAQNSKMELRSTLIIGGASMTRQLESLKGKPHIVIGSAGRILDLIQKKKLSAHTVKTIVIDEADRLLDDLNIEGVKAVIKTTLKERQIVMLSASIGEKTMETAKEVLKEHDIIDVSGEDKLPENIKHFYIKCDWREKINMVRKIIHGEKCEKAIVFLNNPENIEVTVEKLNYHFLKAAGIYGGAYKTERKQALDDFRMGRVKVLVASDIGARGLDIEGITHIINLDISEEPVYYLHRAGRTGRKGEFGIAISVITDFEKKWINKYERVLGIKFEGKEMSFGKLVDIKKEKDSNLEKKPKEKINKEEVPPKIKKLKKDNYIQPKSKAKSNKEKDNNMGFFAKKAEKLAKKEKNIKK